jgi:hypothetical protein
MALPLTVRFANKSKAIWKFVLSFRKRSWILNDYPVWIRKQEPDTAFIASRFKQYQYHASIVGWTLSGGGDSLAAAIDELNSNFEKIKAKKMEQSKPLPRPGTTVPIEYASQDRVNLHSDLEQDFIRRVLDLEWAWISDESSLWDFHEEETNNRLNEKIMEVYGIDVSDIESGNLSEIFERIASKERSLG